MTHAADEWSGDTGPIGPSEEPYGLEYIRKFYGKPARIGQRVMIDDGRTGTITGAHDALLVVKLDFEPFKRYYHPDSVEYIAQALAARE